MTEPPVVAAIVNDEPIYEEDVTSFIEGFRTKNTEYETDKGWAGFLRANGYTPESMRSYVLNSVFIPKMLIHQECASRGIQVSDADLDAIIALEKEYYEQRYGTNSWDSVLSSFGYDESSWRQNELDRLLEEELRNAVVEDATPDTAELQATADENASSYSGKSSYYLSFASEQEAREAYDKLTLPVTLESFTALGEPTYAGWNSLPAYRDAMSKEYIQALNGLEAGQVALPFKSGDSWILLFCDSVFNAASDSGPVDLAIVPPEIIEQLTTDARNVKADRLFDEWLEAYADSSAIDISPMPDGLPYNVNVTLGD